MFRRLGITIILSFFLPGAGQIYNGKIVFGLIVFVATSALLAPLRELGMPLEITYLFLPRFANHHYWMLVKYLILIDAVYLCVATKPTPNKVFTKWYHYALLVLPDMIIMWATDHLVYYYMWGRFATRFFV